MAGAGRADVRQWLSAARHPARRDGLVAAALLVLPWPLAWAVAPDHHLDAAAVGILAGVTIGLSTLWLTWAAFRTASRADPTDGGSGGGAPTVGPDAVVGDRGGTAIGPGSVIADRVGTAMGQVVYQPHREMTGKPVRLAAQPPLLAGREGLLTELDTQLTTGDDPRPRTVVLCGLGGVGKTSAAVAYAHQHLTEVGVAWQFAAEDPTVLAAGFGELAALLGARDAADTRDPVASVHAVLAGFPGEWLLVFDNAPGRASVEGLLPPAGNGRVLITTQNQHWPRAQALQVPVLGTDAAAGFLVNRTGDADTRAAAGLAAELGGLPLALEQAAAYIQATGTTLAGYLALFGERRAELLARGEAAGHELDVAATLGLALSRLGEDALVAVGLVRLLAFLAPEPVPLALLLSGGQAVDLAPDVA